jgi:hypothetical protein
VRLEGCRFLIAEKVTCSHYTICTICKLCPTHCLGHSVRDSLCPELGLGNGYYFTGLKTSK